MAFFKDLGKVIGDAATDTQKKAALLLEVNKLNSAVRTEKDSITRAQERIGAAMFSLFKAGDPVPESIIAECQSITTNLDTIKGLEAKIAELKPDEQKVEEAKPAGEGAATAAGSKFCSGCGAPLTPGAAFCNQCGQKNG